MRSPILPLLAVALAVPVSAAFSQAATPTTHHVYSYMKVAPAMESDYLKLEQAWKKIHVARKQAGKMDDWILLRVLSPSGSGVQYNYITRNTFVGDDKLAAYYESEYMPDKWQSLLTPEEVALVGRTESIRSIVKEEVWAGVDGISADDVDKATIAVFNYFTFPEGKTRADHIQMERDIWKPVHAARVKDGSLKAWLLLQMEMPFGAAQPYSDATVDVYANMKQYLTGSPVDYFKMAHPDRNLDMLLAQTSANAKLVRGEVRMIVDRLN